jgi:hypothetical protein
VVSAPRQDLYDLYIRPHGQSCALPYRNKCNSDTSGCSDHQVAVVLLAVSTTESTPDAHLRFEMARGGGSRIIYKVGCCVGEAQLVLESQGSEGAALSWSKTTPSTVQSAETFGGHRNGLSCFQPDID